MAPNHSKSITYGILAGTSLYCLSHFHSQITSLPVFAYVTVLTNSIVGILEDADLANVGDIMKTTHVVQTLFAFPCVTGTLWLGHHREISYLHPGISLIPLVLYFTDKYKNELVDVILALNMISCIYISAINENWYGVATAVVAAITYGFEKENRFEDNTLTKQDIINIFNVGICVLALYAIGHSGHSISITI